MKLSRSLWVAATSLAQETLFDGAADTPGHGYPFGGNAEDSRGRQPRAGLFGRPSGIDDFVDHAVRDSSRFKSEVRHAKVAAFNSFCQGNEVLPITDPVVVRAADIYADLRARGQLIPDADILVAATAIENGLVLATNNLSDFVRIPGLQIDNWLS